MTYIKPLNRENYDFLIRDAEYAGGQKVKDAIVARPNSDDDRSRQCIDAMFNVIGRADELECIVDEAPNGTTHKVIVTNIHNMRKAVLTINYNNATYKAEVTLGDHKQVSLKNGPRKAAETIEMHLLNKKPTTKKVLARAGQSDEEDDKYSHLTAQFD